MIHMSKKCVLAFLLTALLAMTSTAFAATGVVTPKALILRQAATTESKALQTLPQGTKLEIESKVGSWYKVTYGRFTGYVYASYVRVTEDAANDSNTADDTLKKGVSGTAVKKLQLRLRELGFFKDSVATGYYGDVTVAAVKAFQKMNDLPEDGIAGTKTLNKINSSTAKGADGKVVSQAEPTKTPAVNDGSLKKGVTSSEVKKLQQRLKDLGFFKDSVATGYYGDITVEAVKAFQKMNGLTADGVAGTKTLNKINSSTAKGANGKVYGQATPTNTPAPTDGTLKKGVTSNEVKKLQQRLRDLGFFKNSVATGYYGDITVEAVKAFQKMNGLTADGTAGTKTLNKLYSSTAKNASGKVPGQAAAPTNTPAPNSGVMQKGSKGDDVKKLQESLRALGYFTDSVATGYFGDVTVEAVTAFQKMNGLKQTGTANGATLNKLDDEKAIAADGKTADTLRTNQTLKKGDSNVQVKALQRRLKALGYYTGSVDGDYGLATATAVSEFQRGNKLTVNGTANATTLKKMVSSGAVTKAEADKNAQESAPTYKTENLDWFKNGQSLFRRKTTLKVKDCRTGLVFTARVLYGTNHLDVEPLTAADTAILLKINGGVEFKHYRRPMLVLYNGHVYAASIYSEPHGDQSITNNNFDGQFCLHFDGSMTHGTGVVDSDHQNCVSQALKYTW